LAGDFERRALLAERQLASTGAADGVPQVAAPVTGPGQGAVTLGDYSRVQLELHTTREQLDALRKLLDARNQELERRAAESKRRAEEALRPMPLGVRECLNGLHDCLRREGFSAQRFLRATAVDAEGLHDVEMLESDADGLAVTFFTAERMTATFDRGAGRLELRFFGGHRSTDGQRAELPDDGFLLAFHDVDGRLIEERLPYLVRGEGAYPIEVREPRRPPGDLDPGSRRQWASRLSRLLAESGMQWRWSATRLRGLFEGRFLRVELVGTDAKGMVIGSAHCAKVAVEIDEARNVVSLLLQDGVLRRDGVESTIDKAGYRMLLPKLNPKKVTDMMLGMVVKR